ncbi:MAG TPA: thiamine phosphate synthase [Acidimicrobiales bacterium]|nr:thiamine phosphate synthase [Acidimicrobiales bacterium]
MSGAVIRSDRWGLGQRRLYLCTPDRPDLEYFVEACIEGGVDVVQLREKHLSDDRLATRAALVQRVCGHHGVPFILNDNPDLAAAIGADGVHIGQDDVPPPTARQVMGDQAIIGLSTHTPADLDAAIGAAPPDTEPIDAEAGWRGAPVDYISAGPVVATPTKPGRPGTGLGYISEAVKRAPMSVWVTGGADPVTVVDMIGAGASHVVAVRWLTEAADPRANARSLRRSIDETLDRDGG